MLPKRGLKPDTKRVPPFLLKGRQKQLFKALMAETWLTPAKMPAGYRFSAYIFELKAKGYVFSERWQPITIDGKTRQRGVKAFKLISYPKN